MCFIEYIIYWKMCNVIFDFDYLNVWIVSVCELCVFVKGCLMFYVNF